MGFVRQGGQVSGTGSKNRHLALLSGKTDLDVHLWKVSVEQPRWDMVSVQSPGANNHESSGINGA